MAPINHIIFASYAEDTSQPIRTGLAHNANLIAIQHTDTALKDPAEFPVSSAE